MMARNILVSIVSQQTLPNYLLIKEFQNKIDKYVFISTKEMEKNNITNRICDTSVIDQKNRNKTLIQEDLLNQNIEKLNKLNLSDDDTYFVNLTGGTKLMAITVYNFFYNFKNVRYFYIPIGKNIYREIFTNKKATENPFNYKISVKEYLSIYGIKFEQDQNIFTKKQAFDLFNDVKSNQFNLDNFPTDRLEEFKIPADNKQIHTKWFEEYLFYKIKNLLNLSDNDIKTGIKLFEISKEKENKFYANDNEIDVFFIYKNNPFLIEAKFSVGKEKVNTSALNKYIFKLAAVNKRFGLRAKATLMTLSSFSNMSDTFIENLERRCDIANVVFPFDRDKIIDDLILKIQLQKFIK